MQNYSTGRYARSRDRLVAGVCAMIAKQTGIDVGIVRIIVAAAAVLSGGTIIPIAYVIAWIVLPMEGENHTVLDDWIGKGKTKVADYQATRTEASPASTSQTAEPPTADATNGSTNGSGTFNPYE